MSEAQEKPEHIAIIMDGNGRWARQRGLPRAAGHRAGIKTLRSIVEHCSACEIKALTVYAFSSENWRRPAKEVNLLMELFVSALDEQVQDLHRNNVSVRFIGDLDRFPAKLQGSIDAAAQLTNANTGLQLRVAANYGGRWDICNAFKKIISRVSNGEISMDEVDENLIGNSLELADLPDPDLFIRTGGERRTSNYLLWQLAYTEMYFSDIYWPDFSIDRLEEACQWFSKRQRRFGRTSEQVMNNSGA